MVLDYGKANKLRGTKSTDSDGSRSADSPHTPEEKILASHGRVSVTESVDAHNDCDLAFITEDVIGGMTHLPAS
jgi:hypothetical protein